MTSSNVWHISTGITNGSISQRTVLSAGGHRACSSGTLPGLTVCDLTAGYGNVTVVSDASLSVTPGEVTLLIGRNGSGKSTLIKAIFGLARVRRGEVFVDGHSLVQRPIAEKIAAGIRYVPQTGGLFPSLLVSENLELAAEIGERDHSAAVARTLDLFPALGEMLKRHAGELSGGQQRLLSFAMGIVTSPRFLLIDEPSAGLSPRLAGTVMGYLRTIREELGTGILLVEQNVQQACQVADFVHLLRDGRIHWSGTRDELLAQPAVVAFL